MTQIVKRILPSYSYAPDSTLDFNIELINVPVVEENSVEYPDVNKERIREAVAKALSVYPSRLRGNHVNFLKRELRFSDSMLSILLDYPELKSWADNKYGTCPKWRVERDLRYWLAQLFYPDDDAKLGKLFRDTRTSKKFDGEYKIILIDAQTYEYSFR